MSRIPKLLIALLLLLSLASCSSDSGESGSTSQAPASGAVETTAAGETTPATETTETTQTTGSDAGSLGIDPCGLLTADEITSATGVEFGEGTLNETISGESQAACDWISTGSEFATAQVLILDAGANAFDSNKSSSEDIFGLTTESVDIPGADRTYATAEGSIVAMDIGGIFVQVAYLPSGPGTVLDATVQLATIAASRMP